LALQRGLALGAIALLLIGGWLALENNRLRHQLSAEQSAKTELMRHEQELQARLNDQRAASLQTEQELAQLRNEREQAGKETSKGSSLIATLVLNPQMRGSGQVPGVKIEPETKSLAAHLNLEPNDYTAYRVSLIDQANHQTRWTSPVLKATNGANKTLTVGIRTDLLKSQSYVLRVTGLLTDGSAEVMSDYPFRVLK
jgi:hypothetical protein